MATKNWKDTELRRRQRKLAWLLYIIAGFRASLYSANYCLYTFHPTKSSARVDKHVNKVMTVVDDLYEAISAEMSKLSED